MAQIVNIAPTTELEAVNAMLSAIGEAPILQAQLDTPPFAEVSTAISLLRNATRELQSVPWRFNFETGVELAPANTILWSDSTGAITTLNVFKVPAGVSSWKMTKCSQNGDLDLVQRPSKQYVENGAPAIIMYDREYNRDGADAAVYSLIYIDTISAFNFEQMPEQARRVAYVAAGRRLAQQVVGSGELAGFAAQDEALARRLLQKAEGDTQELNMLNTIDAFRILGERPRVYGGFMQTVKPGPNPVPLPFVVTDLSNVRRTD